MGFLRIPTIRGTINNIPYLLPSSPRIPKPTYQTLCTLTNNAPTHSSPSLSSSLTQPIANSQLGYRWRPMCLYFTQGKCTKVFLHNPFSLSSNLLLLLAFICCSDAKEFIFISIFYFPFLSSCICVEQLNILSWCVKWRQDSCDTKLYEKFSCDNFSISTWFICNMAAIYICWWMQNKCIVFRKLVVGLGHQAKPFAVWHSLTCDKNILLIASMHRLNLVFLMCYVMEFVVLVRLMTLSTWRGLITTALETFRWKKLTWKTSELKILIFSWYWIWREKLKFLSFLCCLWMQTQWVLSIYSIG